MERQREDRKKGRREEKERVVGMRGETTVRHNYMQIHAHACLPTGREMLAYYTTKELYRESIARYTYSDTDGVDRVVVLQCAVKYDIVGDGRAVELFRINEDTGVITLTQPFTIDDAILYKV